MASTPTVTRGPQSAEATVEAPANTEDPELPMRNVPIPTAPEAWAEMRDARLWSSSLEHEVALVAIASAISTHGLIDAVRVAAIRRVYEEGGPLPLPTVTEFRGGYFIEDGHHRFHAAKAAGLAAIEAHVYHLPDPETDLASARRREAYRAGRRLTKPRRIERTR